MPNPRSATRTRQALDVLFILLAVGALKRTFADAENYAEDFHVYWKAAHSWLSGLDPYSFTPEDKGFVFKYPPWILPLFLPIGWMDWEWARRTWFVLEVACVSYAMRWVVRQGVSRHMAAFTACLFWWMFHAHFAAGQFTLILLFVALWAWPADIRPGDPAPLKQENNGFREAFLTYILSAKVFSLFTLAGIRQRFARKAPWLWGLGLLGASHGLLALVSWLTGSGISLEQYYRGFMAAAASGGSELGAEIVRGQGNHGLTALVLRSLGVDSLGFASDMTTSAGLALVLGGLWGRFSRGLSEAERWSGWIGIGLIAHPLAWHHSFVMAYPLCALAIARSVASRSRPLLALALLGTCCIGIVIPQVVGKENVKPLELAGMKSWGAVLAAAALALASRRVSRRRPAVGAGAAGA